MGLPGGPRCPLAPVLLPFLALLAAAGDQGSSKCQEKAVAAGGELRLLPEKPPQGWVKVHWRVRLDTGDKHRILTANRNKTFQFSNNPFLGRASFRQENLSLWISRVITADSGLYWAEFEDTTGIITPLCFRVSVWEPLGQPHLETHILHREQDLCNLSLLCTVPGATNVSYSWSCNRGPPGAQGHQPWLHLQVPGDSDPTVCLCNATNLVSWSTATTDVTAACHAAPGLLSILPWWAVAVTLLLALAISVAIVVTRYWWRKRRKDPPAGQVEQTITVYEEVGKTRTGQVPPQNGTSETPVEGNTIYAVITKTQGPSHPREPETCTIYSMIQPSRKVRLPGCDRGLSAVATETCVPSFCHRGDWFTVPLLHCLMAASPSAPQSPSLKRKRLDPALVSTAYVEVTGARPVRR
ncbi:natural killer cell receptor 2B4-like [Numenius arquata]|uniref:natural killer cell receptor 2B4-like n=1 Tax=Numenius arquata TaxID=31919 RepID=UPI003D304427